MELHEDDPEAMMALLAHIYGHPYAYPEGDDPLQKLALLSIAADKYQLDELQGILYGKLESKIQSQFFDPEDFFNAIRTIFTSTAQNSRARRPIISGCASYLEEFQQDRDFVALLKDFPDLSIGILTSHELASAFPGDWACESGFSGEYMLCDGVPTCSYEKKEPGKEPTACGYQFTRLVAWRHHNIINWLCPSCGNTTYPKCSGCHMRGAWRRGYGRIF